MTQALKEQNGLNVNQLKAVNWEQGPLLVLAGPGSGATVVLARRIARLIRESPEARFRVLALTFTTKAASEIRKRVERMLGTRAARARVATFHSFCAAVLRQHGNHIGVRSDFELLPRDEDRIGILEESLRDTDSPEMSAVGAARVTRMIDHLFREAYDGAETTELPFNGYSRSWIRALYNSYLDTLIAGNHLDHGALLVCCLRLFRERPRIARHYRIVYPHVCVDEYQDTNKCQDLLLRFLCPMDGASLLVVADDDQSINRWHGATPARLDDLRHDYRMEVVNLPASHRCPAAVIELANNLMKFNIDRATTKRSLTTNGTASRSETVRVQRFRDQSSEVAWVAADIRKRAIPPRNVAVLARGTKLLEAAADALGRSDMVPDLRQPNYQMESAPFRFVYSALRLAVGPRETDQMRIMCRAFFDMTEVDVRLDRAEAEGDAQGGSLLRGFLNVVEDEPRAVEASIVIGALRDLVEHMKYVEFSNAVFDWCGNGARRYADNGAENEAERAMWKELTRKASRIGGGVPPLSRFMQEIEPQPKVTPPARDAVHCLTIHSPAGRDFRHVYLMGLAEDQLPSYRATKAEAQPRLLEEERRNCFAAMTGAHATLTLTCADTYFGRTTQPSRFLREMGLSLT